MAQPLDLPLPEITADNFSRAWTRFELVAKAKEWDETKRVAILPTLLRGKLLDHFIELDAETRADLRKLHAALVKTTGLVEDPLSAAKAFVARDQRPDEKVADFASALKKLFRQAYPDEPATSKVLLQRFLTGLRPPISQQLLLRAGRPEELAKAVQDAEEVEYALSFDQPQTRDQRQQPTRTEPTHVNAVSEHRLQPTAREFVPKTDEQLKRLQTALDEMTKRMEMLETTLKTQAQASRFSSRPAATATGATRRSSADRNRRVCFLCGQEGHIRRNCPLNYTGPARMAGGWPGQQH